MLFVEPSKTETVFEKKLVRYILLVVGFTATVPVPPLTSMVSTELEKISPYAFNLSIFGALTKIKKMLRNTNNDRLY